MSCYLSTCTDEWCPTASTPCPPPPVLPAKKAQQVSHSYVQKKLKRTIPSGFLDHWWLFEMQYLSCNALGRLKKEVSFLLPELVERNCILIHQWLVHLKNFPSIKAKFFFFNGREILARAAEASLQACNVLHSTNNYCASNLCTNWLTLNRKTAIQYAAVTVHGLTYTTDQI